MPAIISIYNDGSQDFQALRVNPRTGGVFGRDVVSSDQEGPTQIRLTTDEILIITTADADQKEPKG